MKNTEKIFTGIVLGMLTGVVAGLLIAPDRGKETRKKIKKRAEDLKGNLTENFNKYKGKVEDYIEKEFKSKE